MSQEQLIRTIQSLVAVPTAPFREHWISERIDTLLAEIPGIQVERDAFGNRIARLKRGDAPALGAVFVAHLDHPGFLLHHAADRVESSQMEYWIHFEGRVFDQYFPGARIRLFHSPADSGIAAEIIEAEPEGKETGYRRVRIRSEEPIDDVYLGMWDVPVFEFDGRLITARVCDDLIGCATILCAMHELASEDNVDITAIFSRAEEAGFCGVMCLIGEKKLPALIPEDPVFVSVETSSEHASISIGDGAIIRLGDRVSTFDGALTDTLQEIAHRDGVRARRVLMDKGTCEATPFARAGYRAGGICIPLRNYHNMVQGSSAIAPEQVDIGDVREMIRLIKPLSVGSPKCSSQQASQKADYDLYLRKGRNLLPEKAPSAISNS